MAAGGNQVDGIAFRQGECHLGMRVRVGGASA